MSLTENDRAVINELSKQVYELNQTLTLLLNNGMTPINECISNLNVSIERLTNKIDTIK
jgi:hypothetical protein